MYPPEVRGPNQRLMPRALHYYLPNKLKKHKDAKLNAYRAFLDGMTGVLVHWDLWDGLDEPYLAQSREVTRGRVLLESPYGWQWYF